MSIHSKSVTNIKGNNVTIYIRGTKIWLSYYVDGVRRQKSTRLENTSSNMKLVNNTIIPKLNMQIVTGDIHKKKPKTFEYYGGKFLIQKQKLKSYHSKILKWNRVIEFFENREIDSITRLDIKEYLNSLDIKSSSKAPYRSCLIEIFELAMDDEIITSNPAQNIKLSKDIKEAIKYYTKEEVNTLIHVADGILKVYLQIAFNTGLRTGEILGLQLGDFEDNYISIKRTRTKGIIGSGKTYNAIRKVPYPSFILNEVKKIQTDNIFIFGNIDDAGKLDYLWRQCNKIANIPKLRLYCTRHTYATLMLKNKVLGVTELAGVLGHSSAKITLERYASVIDPSTINLDPEFSLYCDNTVTMDINNNLKAL